MSHNGDVQLSTFENNWSCNSTNGEVSRFQIAIDICCYQGRFNKLSFGFLIRCEYQLGSFKVKGVSWIIPHVNKQSIRGCGISNSRFMSSHSIGYIHTCLTIIYSIWTLHAIHSVDTWELLLIRLHRPCFREMVTKCVPRGECSTDTNLVEGWSNELKSWVIIHSEMVFGLGIISDIWVAKLGFSLRQCLINHMFRVFKSTKSFL